MKIRLFHEDTEVETAVLVNTGFEAEQPEILLPVKLAKKLDSILLLMVLFFRNTAQLEELLRC